MPPSCRWFVFSFLLFVGVEPAAGQVVDKIIPRTSRMEVLVGRPDTARFGFFDRRGNEVPADQAHPFFVAVDTTVAGITQEGVVLGRKAGSTRIRVQVGARYGWIQLSVADIPPPPPLPVTSGFLKLPQPEIHLTPGESEYARAIYRRSDGLPATDVLIKYATTNPAVAIVDSLTGRITAMTAGLASITVTAPGTGVTPAAVSVTVGEPTLKISSDSLFLIEGTPDTLSLLVQSQGSRPYHGPITWESGNTNVAKIDSTGVIVGVTRGTAQITVTTPYFTGQATVQVFSPGIARSSLPPDTAITLPLGTTTDLVIRGYNPDTQQPLYIIPTTWTVEDTNIAYYDRANGQIVARSNGQTKLTGQPRIRSMSRPRVWRIIVFSGKLVPEVERTGLRTGMKQTISGILLDTTGARLNRPVQLRWDEPAAPGIQISTSGAVSVTLPGRYELTGRAPWGAALSVTVFGLYDLIFSEVDGKGSVVQGMLMNTGQRTPQAVFRSPSVNMEAAISPDRSRMVFSSNRNNGDFDLFLADPDGSNERLLLRAPGKDQQPVWFPSGERIAFTAIRPGRPLQIYTIRPDGTELRRLTDSLVSAAAPAIAPDGSRIVYESLRAGSQYDLFSLRLTGDSVAPGTREQQVLASLDNERSPRFFPNGDLAFIREEVGGKRNRLLMRLVAGAQLTQALTPPDLYVRDFAISPDGNYVVFSAPPPGERSSTSRYRLYLLDLRQPGVPPTILYAPSSGGVGAAAFVP